MLIGPECVSVCGCVTCVLNWVPLSLLSVSGSSGRFFFCLQILCRLFYRVEWIPRRHQVRKNDVKNKFRYRFQVFCSLWLWLKQWPFERCAHCVFTNATCLSHNPTLWWPRLLAPPSLAPYQPPYRTTRRALIKAPPPDLPLAPPLCCPWGVLVDRWLAALVFFFWFFFWKLSQRSTRHMWTMCGGRRADVGKCDSRPPHALCFPNLITLIIT